MNADICLTLQKKSNMKFYLPFLFFASLLVGMTACKSTGQAKGSAAATEAAAMAPVKGTTFGATFQPEKVLSYEELVASVPAADSLSTVVKGTVEDVCQMKGCWMNIAGTDGEAMMVRFKDYGFFMPKDIAGREVIMSGKAFFQTTPVDELRHYAEDAGKSPEEVAKITEPKRELSFLADGVILVEE
jgi:hypothetical protein